MIRFFCWLGLAYLFLTLFLGCAKSGSNDSPPPPSVDSRLVGSWDLYSTNCAPMTSTILSIHQSGNYAVTTTVGACTTVESGTVSNAGTLLTFNSLSRTASGSGCGSYTPYSVSVVLTIITASTFKYVVNSSCEVMWTRR